MTNKEKIALIAHNNGLELALDKLAEECAEYAAARIKDNIGGETINRYPYELADVVIMVEEVKLLIEDSRPGLSKIIQKEIESKLDRQLQRIKEREYENY